MLTLAASGCKDVSSYCRSVTGERELSKPQEFGCAQVQRSPVRLSALDEKKMEIVQVRRCVLLGLSHLGKRNALGDKTLVVTP